MTLREIGTAVIDTDFAPVGYALGSGLVSLAFAAAFIFAVLATLLPVYVMILSGINGYRSAREEGRNRLLGFIVG
jgi:hypothetical protein